MSRIGKNPVPIPAKVAVELDGLRVAVKGPLGQLEQTFKGVGIESDGKVVTVSPNGSSRTDRAMWGLTRSLINNMVMGVSQGFERVLEINGVGYRADLKGRELHLSLGHSHPIHFPLPAGVDAEVIKMTTIKLRGVDKQLLGQTAATIRAFRPPEPYKGKGVKYAEEHIRRKVGKAAK